MPFENKLNGIKKFPETLMKSLMVYLTDRLPDIYNKDFWKTAEIEYYNKLQRHDYTLLSKTVSIVTFQSSHIRDYLIYEHAEGGEWVLTGMATQNDRTQRDFKFEMELNGGSYWLVVETEVDHGNECSMFNKVWYNSDGTVALQYQANGYELQYTCLDNNTLYSYFMEYESFYDFLKDDSDLSITVKYNNISFYYSDYALPIYKAREYAVYQWNDKARGFELNEKRSSVKPVHETENPAPWKMLTEKYSYNGKKTVTLLDDWVSILKEMDTEKLILQS
jgi:hypothetical protein